MDTATEQTASAVTERGADTHGEQRVVAIRVNLLPDEIAAGRRTDVLRKQVILGLAALFVVIVLGFGFSWWQTHSAQSDLESAQSSQSTLQRESRRYEPLITAKATTAGIQTQLRLLMAGDVTWNDMLSALRSVAPRGVTISQIDGTVTAGAAGGSSDASTADPLNQSGLEQIGSITLTASGKDKRAIADFTDALVRVKGLAAPLVRTINVAEGRTTATVEVAITSAARGGRYQSAPRSGGK